MIPAAEFLRRRRAAEAASLREPGGVTWVRHTDVRMPRHPDEYVFGRWHPPAAAGWAVRPEET